MKVDATVIAELSLIGGACLMGLTPAVAAATATTTTPASKPIPASKMGEPVRVVEPNCPVIQLQEALNANGAGLRVDGIYGPKTEADLKTYQRDHHLVASGELDDQTRASLSILG